MLKGLALTDVRVNFESPLCTEPCKEIRLGEALPLRDVFVCATPTEIVYRVTVQKRLACRESVFSFEIAVFSVVSMIR